MSPPEGWDAADRAHRAPLRLRDAAVVFVPLVLLVAGVLSLAWSRDRSSALGRLAEEERLRVEAAQQTLPRVVTAAFSDLLILARSEALRRYISAPNPDSRMILEQFLDLVLQQKASYAEVRLVDLQGRDRVRLERTAAGLRVVPAPELQSEPAAGPIPESARLDRNTILVSPIELSVEQGEPERPLTPVIHFATPVFTADEQRWGRLVLDLSGARITEAFHEVLSPRMGQGMLLDSRGCWIEAPDDDLEWGGTLPGRPCFLDVYPEADEVLVQKRGQLRVPQGLFTYATVHPLEGASAPAVTPAESGQGTSPSYTWKIVTFVPDERLEAALAAEVDEYVLVSGISLGCILLVSASFAGLRATGRRSRALQALWARVMGSTLDGVSISDRRRRIISINHAFSAISGYTPGEVYGAPHDLLSARTDPALSREQLQALREHGQWKGERVYRRRDGEVFPALVRLSALTGEGGELTHIVETFTDITDRKLVEEHLERLAREDALTGLANRTLFDDRLEMALANAHRRGEMVVLIFIDLVRFKPINDIHGHEAGDLVLQEVGRRLVARTRENDTVARLGGDEFAIILQTPGPAEAVSALVEELRAAGERPIDACGVQVQVGISLGTARFPDEAATPEELRRKADAAMYADKRTRHGEAGLHPTGPH